jgi:competence CoiA-like predicted nuclease
MLCALNESSDRVVACDATKGSKYSCPVCGEGLILRQGSVMVHHYAHRSKSDCTWGGGESQKHLQYKMDLYDGFQKEGMSPILEDTSYKTEFGVIPDITVEGYAVEVQLSPIGYDEIQRRSRSLWKAGLRPIWVFDYAIIEKEISMQCYVYDKLGQCLFWDSEYSKIVVVGRDNKSDSKSYPVGKELLQKAYKKIPKRVLEVTPVVPVKKDIKVFSKPNETWKKWLNKRVGLLSEWGKIVQGRVLSYDVIGRHFHVQMDRAFRSKYVINRRDFVVWCTEDQLIEL